jgi:hypothetical protein
MLTEFERRFLEVAQNHLDLLAASKAAGALLPPEYFGYALALGTPTTNPAGPLTSGVTFQGIIPIQADSWFLLEYISVGVVLSGATVFGDTTQMTDGGNLLLQVTDTGLGQELYNLPQGLPGFPAILLAGSPITAAAGIPYVFPTPRLLPPMTNVKVEMTKLGTNAGLDNPDMLGAYIMLNGARIPLGGNV